MTETIVQPNFIKLSGGRLRDLFWDTYAYIDIPGYAIDEVLNNSEHNIAVKFLQGTYTHPGKPYMFCFLRCRHKYSKIMTKYIFPTLHNKIVFKYGKEYLDFCVECANALIQGYEQSNPNGNAIDVFCLPEDDDYSNNADN